MPTMSSGEGRGRRGAGGGCAFRQGLSHNTRVPSVPVPETSSPGGPPGGPAVSPLPSPSPGVSPAFYLGEGGRRWHRLEEGNKSPHSSLWKEMPSSGGGGQRIVWREAGAPRLSPPAHPSTSGLRSTPTPAPSPPGSSPGARGRGRPPLVVCLEGKEGRRGEKPKVGLAEGLAGNSTTLA